MFSLIYKSSISESTDLSHLDKMFEKARIFNCKNNITGFLIYHKNTFIQLLEGERGVVKNLFGKIKDDPRHSRITVLNTEQTVTQMFDKWTAVYDPPQDCVSSFLYDKKELFRTFFRTSAANCNPGVSKLFLWEEVNNILSNQKLFMAG